MFDMRRCEFIPLLGGRRFTRRSRRAYKSRSALGASCFCMHSPRTNRKHRLPPLRFDKDSRRSRLPVP